ncbi:hypothetical protein LNQ82_01225 [Conchiformibius steedae DSM 2580]|uniref:Uncharacterized protein n=1 Tax=Conchiformibius steedae DSM 2580 TaxID=1121352 RepID=A0AAE9HTE9_9NEIS|nr:hypothetical protein [Conchiformibius steedae]QMT33177.1 hypothetical protein H3L98_08770 [Conchiformibius steedae]URD67814.1 hypothetical protein LNQ82_01225 [Conchiformibius steedae DSM 2580]
MLPIRRTTRHSAARIGAISVRMRVFRIHESPLFMLYAHPSATTEQP